jgi:hypothetical protein
MGPVSGGTPAPYGGLLQIPFESKETYAALPHSTSLNNNNGGQALTLFAKSGAGRVKYRSIPHTDSSIDLKIQSAACATAPTRARPHSTNSSTLRHRLMISTWNAGEVSG